MARRKPKRKPVRTVPVGRNTVPHKKAGHKKAPGRKIVLDRPPPGTYDPNLDVGERAATRGYRNTLDDIATSRERGATDFGLGQGDIARQQGEVNRQYGENLSDLIRSRTEGQQDYQTNLQGIARNFSRLGNVQAQRGRQAGLRGGFARQAQRKRDVNQQLERAPVDLGFKRFIEGSKLAETRLGQAKQRSLDEVDRSGGALDLSYQRGDQDLTTTESRAGNEFQNYLQDVAAARQAQYGGPLPTIKLPGKKPKPTRSQRTRARKTAGKRALGARI
jgi:hypothetical protein